MARKIATWRPVAITIWDDLKFLSLSDDSKLLFLYFITSSDCPIPGVLIVGEATVAERRGWTVDKVRACYSEMLKKGIDVRWEGRVLWCANGFKHQPVAGPNAMKSMATAWLNIPQVSFTHLLWTAIRDATKGWSREFKELFPEPARVTVPVTSPSDQVPLPWGTPSPHPVADPLTQPRTPTPSLQEGLDTATATATATAKAPGSGTAGFSNPSFSESESGASGGGDHDPARPAPALRLVPDDRVDPKVRELAKAIEQSGFNFASFGKPSGGAA